MIDIRAEFPIVRDSVYFNHAGVSPLPARSAGALAEWCERAQVALGYDLKNWSRSVTAARANSAALMGCSSEEIALVHNTTHGLLVVANSIGWRPGDNVLLAEHEFPANLYPWQNLAGRGVACRLVPERRGRFAIDDFVERMDERTRLVTISLVQYSTGFRMPVQALGAACRERGILLCVDGIQALGCLPVDVESLGCDFLAAGGHKWMLGPEGLGALYVRRSALEQMGDSMTGWIGREGQSNYDDPDRPLLASALRFEEGGHARSLALAFERSTGLLLEVGAAQIWSRIEALTDRLAEGLRSADLEIVSSRATGEKSGIVAFRPPRGSDPTAWVTALAERKIYLVARRGWLRASPHFYNQPEQIDTLLGALAELKRDL